MKAKLSDIYIYLARRDKTGIRVLAKVKGQHQLPSRIGDLKMLNMPPDWTANIARIIESDKMLWEPWLQSADSHAELIESLRKRGFTNISSKARPEYGPASLQTPIINSANLPNKKTMIRKN